MNLEIDQDVKLVAEFMQRNIPLDRILYVAAAVADTAPLFWGSRKALSLNESPISASRPEAATV